MSSMLRPARASTLWVAGMGAVSMKIGSSPATEKEWKRARGVSPSFDAISSLMISAADAPSVSGDELPGVIDHCASGKRCAYFSE